MGIKNQILLITVLIPFFTLAQGENNNWYFGYGAGLHFENNGSVTFIDGGKTLASEGVSSISSRDGELLFYTDGSTIFNRNHEIMVNGDGLFGTEASTQSSVIVPLPQSPDRYYVFTTDVSSSSGVRGRGLNYSVVDMAQDNGNGAVIEKNTNLLGDCAEKLAIVIGNCNSETLWLVTISTVTGVSNPVVPPFPNFNTYHAFKIDAGGVSVTSVASTFSVNHPFDQGYLTFSPDGTKLADAHMQSGLYISDFDKDSGKVSNLENIEVIDTPFAQAYGAAFSPNSQYLYVNIFKKRPFIPVYDAVLLQYDVLVNDVTASKQIIDDSSLTRGALQLSVDGKIYYTLTVNFENDYIVGTPIEDGISYLGVINNPNEKGVACNYEPNAIEILGNRVRQGLPPLVQSFFSEVKLNRPEDILIDGNLAACLGASLVVETQQIPGAIYTWTKDGNPLPVAEGNRIEITGATNADEGEYGVTIIRPNAPNCPINGQINVKIYEQTTAADLSITVCDIGDDNASDGITVTNLEELFAGGDFNYTFYADVADQTAETPLADPAAFINSIPFEQLLYYKVANAAGCESFGELVITISEAPEVILEETYRLCAGQANLLIEGPEGFDMYSWFRVDGDVSEIASEEKDFEVLLEGNYMLEASTVFTNNGVESRCSSTTEFEVLISNTAVIEEVIVDLFTDNDTNVEINVTGDGDYEFSSDGTTYQDSNILENVSAGTATISVRDKNGCGVVTQTAEIIPDSSSPFPNFFTPNGDGTNDEWQVRPPPVGETLDILEIRIFDRFGAFLAQLDPNSQGWNGFVNGKPLPTSDYWYVVLKNDGQKIRGHFTLKR